ncbi:MAG: tetratricopeptide repeat protein [Terrimicrobiaceae bacterium]|nr:tetratricopeptide repeat protein [Terrimicrobiaceae bacterium]
MRIGRWIRIGVAILGSAAPGHSAPAAGGAAGQAMTAEELYNASIAAYNSGKFAEAVAGFQKFERDFGKSDQSQAMVAGMRYPLAMSLLHLQKFDAALEAISACLQAAPPPIASQKEDLLFYRGVCEMQGDSKDAARKTFERFAREFPNSRQTSEAMLLHGTTWLLDDKYAEAAAQFAAIRPRLDPVNRGRATVLQLYALLQEQKLDDALALVREEFPRMGQMLQIATFQTLTLQLGTEFLDKGENRNAIAALQRVWPRDRLVKYQKQRLAELNDALAAAEAQPKGDPYRKFQLKQMIAKVRREIESLEKIANFDSALRLRLATAYQAMRRYREAALIMEDMLATLPPDPVVESASLDLIQCWSAIERWLKAIDAAQAFERKFPQSKQLPMALYLTGIAQQRLNDQAAAVATFEAIRTRFPASDFAPRALFMKGFSQLLAEQNKPAIATFEEFQKIYPKNDLADAAAYWLGMGCSLDKQFLRTREVMDEYLDHRAKGSYRGLAAFRKAYAAQSLRDFDTSIRELRAYLKNYPGHESNSEALVLLGDALMDQGDVTGGIAAFERIPPADTRFFEEGWFKVGKAYRLLEEPEKLRAHFERFAKEHPRSPRVAEAIYWIGWTHLQAGRPELAREAYWQAIADHGNDATIRSVDDLFPALQRLYSGAEEQPKYLARLRDLGAGADAGKMKTLALRALWAQALVYRKADPDRSRTLLLDAAARIDPPTTNPLIMADCAAALDQAGRADDAGRMWRDLVKWNPRAAQKADAFAALGMIESARGNDSAALAYFDRFEQETIGSLLFGRVMLAKANLLAARGEPDAARKALEALLADHYTTGPEKAEALYRIGEIFMQQKKFALAVPYFQRIYIMHGRWHDWVAKAYLRSGLAFEELHDKAAARRTYEEMTKLEELQSLPESAEARERLQALAAPASS